jgi:hypothetical protein
MRHLTLILAGLVGSTLASAQESAPAASDKDLRAEVAALRKEVEDLRGQLEEFEQVIQQMTQRMGGPGLPVISKRKLAKITLPENPTDAQVRDYIDKLIAAGTPTNRPPSYTPYGTTDPRIELLTDLGPKRLPLLIEALEDGRSRSLLMPVVTELAGAEHKALILELLPEHKELMTVVSRKGWVKDARPVLLAALKEEGSELPHDWIQAVASLEDPSTYPALLEYFVENSNGTSLYETLRRLPDLDLTDAVAKAWRRSVGQQDQQRMQMARIAAEYGQFSALQFLVRMTRANNEEYQRKEALKLVYRFIDFDGEDDEFKAWWEKNKDRLVFDQESGIFVVGEKPLNRPATDKDEPGS